MSSMESIQIELKFTPQTFTEAIYNLVKHEEMSYIDSVVHLCDDNGIEYTDILHLITPPIRSKIEAEGQERSILPKTNNVSAFMESEDSSL